MYSVRNNQSGQTLLIVVLVMVVALTVGLAVATRSITNLRTTQEEAASQRAFSAAEAGVEQALKSASMGAILADVDLGNNSSIKQVTIDELSESASQFTISGGNVIAKDDGADIWLVSHNADGSVNYSSPLTVNPLVILWGEITDDCNAPSKPAALEIIVISGSLASPKSTRYAYDPCTSRLSSNKFTQGVVGSYVVGGKTFKYKTDSNINITNGLLVRVIPVYANTVIGVDSGGVTLPSQGKKISSTGTSGDTIRKITFFQGYPKLPAEFFQYVLLSP